MNKNVSEFIDFLDNSPSCYHATANLVELLLQGKSNRIICTNRGGFTDMDIDEALDMHKDIQQMEVDVLAAMTGK